MNDVAAAEYSLWLLPCPDDAAWLATLIADLASRYGTPPFIAHVTVQGDSARSCQDMCALARRLALTTAEQRWPITHVASSAHFFRALYLGFDACEDFARLQQDAATMTGTRAGLSPFPHLSLAYGDAPDVAAQCVRELDARCRTRVLTLDRLAVAHSSRTLPIAEWRVVASFALRASD